MRTQIHNTARYVAFLFTFLLFVGVGIGVTPLEVSAQNGRLGKYAAALQDAGQAAPPADANAPAAPPATAPGGPKKVELPEGDGKPIATEYCQDCHRLTNLVRAHKSADDWHDTVQLMIDRGARLPEENMDVLVQYLVKNFGPKTDAPVAATTAAANASASPAAPPAPAAAVDPQPAAVALATPAPATPAAAKPVVLPEGDGKEIATENCQLCHKLTNLTKAHKSLEDWRDTVQLMMDRGATVPADQVETLVQYLAKNFGPKPADSASGAGPASGAPAVSEAH